MKLANQDKNSTAVDNSSAAKPAVSSARSILKEARRPLLLAAIGFASYRATQWVTDALEVFGVPVHWTMIAGICLVTLACFVWIAYLIVSGLKPGSRMVKK